MHPSLRPLQRSPEALLLLLASVAVVALWQVGTVIGPAADRSPAAAALAVAVVALFGAGGVAFMAIRRDGSASRDAAALLEITPGPSAITTVAGRVLACNKRMAEATSGDARKLSALLEHLVEIDASMIYRLARGAVSLGFAFEEVRTRQGDQICYLVARCVAPDRLIWALLAPADLAAAMPGSISERYESAPFCHATVEGGTIVATNVRFRATLGFDPGKPLDKRVEAAISRPGRFLLPKTDGSFALMRSFIGSVADGELSPDHSGEDRREVFLFELRGDGVAERAPGLGLERVPAAILHLDPDARLIWLNKAARRMLGSAAVTGAHLEELIEHRGRPLRSLIDAAMIGQDMTGAETVRLLGANVDNPQSFAQITFSRVEFAGEESVLAVLTDASELRQLEDKFAQSQKMEAVGKLAGGVAHDFNNLLTAINGHCDLLLLGRDTSSPDHADLTQIKQNANRAASLVRQLLAFSRKQTLNPALISLKDVVSDTLYLLDRLIGDRVVLALDHAREETPAMVRADRQQIEQALMNLVVNARDAMPEGGTVTISTRSRHFPVDEHRLGATVLAGDYVELAVADEGTGIEESVIGKVFDPFFTTKPLGEGTGLGLSTVYGIVKQSGGYIFAENRPEGGACFRVLLKRASPNDLTRQCAAPEPEKDRPDLTGRARILLVEDEASVRSVAMRALGMRGHLVTTVVSAREALGLVRDPGHEIDLIITDVMMPEMDGPTFAIKAREIRPGLRVLFISGYAEEAFRKNLTDPEFAFLAKPFSISELTAKVKEVLNAPETP